MLAQGIFLRNWTIFLIKNFFLKLLFFVKTDFWELPIILLRCLLNLGSADSRRVCTETINPCETAGYGSVRETWTSLSDSHWVNLFLIRLCRPLVSSLLISIPFPKITNTSKKLKISIKRGELDVGFNESWIMLSLMCQVYGCNVCDVLLLCVRSLGMWALGRKLTSLARLLPQPSQTSL